MNRRVEGLLIEGNLVEMITQNAKREDDKGQEVASFVRATEDAREDVVVVLCDDPLLAELAKVRFVVRRTCAGNDAIQTMQVSSLKLGLKNFLRGQLTSRKLD